MTLESELKRYAEQVGAFRRERIRHERVTAQLEQEYRAMLQEYQEIAQ